MLCLATAVNLFSYYCLLKYAGTDAYVSGVGGEIGKKNSDACLACCGQDI